MQVQESLADRVHDTYHLPETMVSQACFLVLCAHIFKSIPLRFLSPQHAFPDAM